MYNYKEPMLVWDDMYAILYNKLFFPLHRKRMTRHIRDIVI